MLSSLTCSTSRLPAPRPDPGRTTIATALAALPARARTLPQLSIYDTPPALANRHRLGDRGGPGPLGPVRPASAPLTAGTPPPAGGGAGTGGSPASNLCWRPPSEGTARRWRALAYSCSPRSPPPAPFRPRR